MNDIQEAINFFERSGVPYADEAATALKYQYENEKGRECSNQMVRCGECKYSEFSRTQTQRYTCHYTYSPCRGRCMDADFGCLYGERKGGEK